MVLPKTYYKHNYIEVLKKYIPQIYFEDEILLHGNNQKDLIVDFLNKVTTLSQDFDSYVLNVSSYSTAQVSKFFINKNNLTKVNASVLQSKVFDALKDQLIANGYPTQIQSFESSSQFQQALTSVILPNIHVNHPTAAYLSGVSSYVDPLITTLASAHEFLVNHLGFLYFANTSATQTTPLFQPSAGANDLIVKNIYTSGSDIELVDCLKVFYEYLWYHTDVSPIFASYVPAVLNKGTSGYDGLTVSSYTSGTQHLDRIKILLDIIYLEEDKASTAIETKIDLLAANNYLSDTMEPSGPLFKFFKGLGCSLYDIRTVVDGLEDLLDIERCPKEFFEYLARYLGWRLRGDSLSSWRSQLRQAIYVYKSKGTTNALNNALNHLFPSSIMNPASALSESWESYIPHLFYYTIITESPIFTTGKKGYLRDLIKVVKKQFERLGMTVEMFPTTTEGLKRLLVDYLIARVHQDTGCLDYADEKWKFQLVEDLGRTTVVPPFERDNYYRRIEVTEEQLQSMSSWLAAPTCSGGFDVAPSAVEAVVSYIRSGTLDNEETFLGTHKNWKFFTSANEYSFNRNLLIQRGDADLLDYWNSKSSDVFVTLTASDYWHRPLPENRPFGSSANDMLAETFIEFTPFTVVLNLRYLNEFEDIYPSAVGCPAFEVHPRKDTDQNTSGILLQNRLAGGFSVASGLGTVLTNTLGQATDNPNAPLEALRDNQFLPPPSSTLWRTVQGGATTSAALPAASTWRFSTRRKDFSYALPLKGVHFRDGMSPPIAYQFLSASSVAPTVSSIQNVSSYTPLGFDFYKNRFQPLNPLAFAKNGYLITDDRHHIWDVSTGTEPSAITDDIAVSDTFPTRNMMDHCGSGLRDRSMLDPTLYELWKINDAVPTSSIESVNLIQAPSFETSAWADYWGASAQSNSKVQRRLLETSSYAIELTSEDWITGQYRTSYPRVAGIGQILSGLEVQTEYDLTFKYHSIAPESDVHLNNGVGVLFKQTLPGASSSDYYNFMTESFGAYNTSASKFAPNWGSRKGQGKTITGTVRFRSGDHPENIELQFWGMGGLEAKMLSTARSSEFGEIENTVLTKNYITKISLRKVIEARKLREAKLGEGVHRLWHQYNRLQKQIKSRVFDGGADFESQLYGPHLRGGENFDYWDSSSFSSIDNIVSSFKGSTPILGGHNYIPNGDFRDYTATSGTTMLTNWSAPAVVTGTKEVTLTAEDGPSGYRSPNPPSVSYLNFSSTIDDFWTSAVLPLNEKSCVLSFGYWTAESTSATSGAPTVRLHNYTKEFDFDFTTKQWDPTFGTTANKKYLRMAQSQYDHSPSASVGFWNFFSIVIPHSKEFAKTDQYRLYLAADLASLSYKTAVKFAVVDIQSIEGWRSPQIFDNGYFDKYIDHRANKSILVNQKDNDLAFDYYDPRSFTFLGDGGVRQVDFVMKLNNEDYFKDSNYINVYDSSNVSGWSFADDGGEHTRFNPYVSYLGKDGAYPTSAYDTSSPDLSTAPLHHWGHGSLQFGRSWTSSAISPAFNLRVGASATLSMPIMYVSAVAGGTGAAELTWSLKNETQGVHFAVSDGSWRNDTAHVTTTNDGGAHNFTPLMNVWKTHTVTLPLQTNFDEYDEFRLYLSANDNAAGNQYSRTFVGPITIKNTTNNGLEPNQEYAINFNYRTNSIKEGLGVALRIPQIDSVNWYFDFARYKWVGVHGGDDKIPYKEIEKIKYTTEYQTVELPFHTLNGRRTIPSFDRTWADRNGPVNTRERDYEVVIFRTTPASPHKISPLIIAGDPYRNADCFENRDDIITTIISVEKVAIINKDYNKLLYDASTETNYVSGIDNFKVIYKGLFDTEGHGLLSRDTTKSYPAAISGGSRALYLDQWGMDFNNDGKIDASGTGITVSGAATNLFNFNDD